MTKQFKQFVYFNPNSSHNTTTAEALISGAAFTQYPNITALGVQALPGTKFYINNGAVPVIVGFNGIFSIDLTAYGGIIGSIKFDSYSVAAIEQNDSAYLIVDIIYSG